MGLEQFLFLSQNLHMKKFSLLIVFLICATARAEEPKLPSDPSDPNYQKDLQIYIDHQMKKSKAPAEDNEAEDEEESAELKAMRKKAVKACLDDPESPECKKYRKLHSEILKFGLETMDTVTEHHEKKKETKPKK